MAQTLTRILLYVVFSTRERRNLITPTVESELHAYLGGICRNHESPAQTVGGTDNHVHLLLSLSKNIALSDFMMTLKKDSSKWIKTKGNSFADFHWQDGYGAFSIGESQVRTVTEYIRAQKERHRTMTFEDELVALAKECGVAFDPRYLWTQRGIDDPFRVVVLVADLIRWRGPPSADLLPATVVQAFSLLGSRTVQPASVESVSSRVPGIGLKG